MTKLRGKRAAALACAAAAALLAAVLLLTGTGNGEDSGAGRGQEAQESGASDGGGTAGRESGVSDGADAANPESGATDGVDATDPESGAPDGGNAAGRENSAPGASGDDAADQESGASEAGTADGSTGQEDLRSRDEKIRDAAVQWASAVIAGDEAALASMQKDPSEPDSGKPEDGGASALTLSEYFEVNIARKRDEAVIRYYAVASDPDVFMWKEVLTLEPTESGYAVAAHVLEADPVDSAAAFAARYHSDPPEEYENGGDSYCFWRTPLDYFYVPAEKYRLTDLGQGRLADWYLQQEEQGLSCVDAFRTPEGAAARQLNLSGGRAQEAESPDEEHVCLRWEFDDGKTDVICLCRMDAGMKNRSEQSALWAVEEILTEEKYEERLALGSVVRHYTEHPEELLQITWKGANGLIQAFEEGGRYMAAEIAALDDRSAVLYGLLNDGVFLWENGRCQYFDWIYTSPRMGMPAMDRADYDGDGQEEISVIVSTWSGTECSGDELYVLKKGPDGKWVDLDFPYDEHQRLIGEDICCTYEEQENRLDFFDRKAGRYIGALDLSEFLDEEAVYRGVSFGNIFGFAAEDGTIYLQASPRIETEGWPTGSYGRYVLRARVVYDGKGFSLEDYELADPDGN